jgi:hypothetical protein
MNRQWLMVGGVLAVAVIVFMVYDRSTTAALTPTLSFKPTGKATGGVISNVSDASSGLPGAADLDEENFSPD